MSAISKSYISSVMFNVCESFGAFTHADVTNPCPKSRGLCLSCKEDILSILEERESNDGNATRERPMQVRFQSFRYHHGSNFRTWTIYTGSYAQVHSSHKPLSEVLVKCMIVIFISISLYWLSLPYRFSIPLLTSSAMLRWLVSQALSTYRFVYSDDYGDEIKGQPFQRLGYSQTVEA